MPEVASSGLQLRVLSLLDDLTTLGGVEAFQYDLAAELPKLGIEFRALNLKPRLNSTRELPAWAVDYPANRWLRGPLIKLRGQRFIRQFSPCFFFVHQPASLGFLMTVLPDRRWPVLSIVHNDSTRQQYWQSQMRWRNNILGYVAVSATIRNRLIEEFGVASERVWTIPCGIDTRTIDPGRRTLPPRGCRQLVLLYAGRVASYAKRVLDLVGVVQELNRAGLPKDWRISLHVVGDGPEAERLKHELDSKAGRVEVHCHGRIPREELFRICEQSHITVLLSSFEGMPIALREAMSRGAVPVATDIPAHREIITPGINGFLFPIGDTAECARLCCAIAMNDLYEQVSRNAALWTRDHSAQATAAKYARLLERLSEPVFIAGAKAQPQKVWASS